MNDERVLAELRRLEIETPSWGYGNSGTRFHVYPWPGAARTVWERIDDAALVHRLTGCCPSVAIHVPVGPGRRLGRAAPLRRGAGHPDRGRQPEPLRRRRRTASAASAIPIRRSGGGRSTTASSASRSRRRSARRSSASGSPTARTTPARTICAAATRGCSRRSRSSTPRCPTGCGCSSSTSSSSRPSTAPTCPTGERRRSSAAASARRRRCSSTPATTPQGTNVEQIVALLLAEGLLGGFHFNNRKYADDDLIVGSIDPFELFRIMREIAAARTDPATARRPPRPSPS